MTASFYSIKQSALALSPEEREQLATDLFESLPADIQQQIESAWIEHADLRHNEVVAGKVKTIPGAEVSKTIREILG
jgi:putative addiction module component (TIGR02574 family)